MVRITTEIVIVDIDNYCVASPFQAKQQNKHVEVMINYLVMR